jgi:hypothetical protein
MKVRLIAAAAAALGIIASSSGAQEVDSQCPPGSLTAGGSPDNTMVAQDACQKAIDLFHYMAPQLGTVLAGGNPTQGISGTLGGLGHFSFGIRGNALNGSLPEIDKVVPNTRGARVDTYTIDTKPVGFITADLGIGVFRGLATNGFGSVDALVSASYVPEYTGTDVEVTVPSGSIKLGFGAKVGLLRESSVRPGISVSYLVHALPRVDITGKSGDDRLFLKDVSVKTKSWRAVVGKSFFILGAGAGFGQDSYDSNADITVTVAPRQSTQGGTGGPIKLGQDLTRTNIFGTVWLNAKLMKIVGEVGRVSGGSIVTYNQFDGVQPADARTYYSVGLSFGR